MTVDAERLEREIKDLYQVVGFLTDVLNITDRNRTDPLDNALIALQEPADAPRHNLRPYPVANNVVIDALLTIAAFRRDPASAQNVAALVGAVQTLIAALTNDAMNVTLLFS